MNRVTTICGFGIVALASFARAAPPATRPATAPICERGFATDALRSAYRDPAKMAAALDDMASLGVTWVRFDFTWQEINGAGLGAYSTDRYDAAVRAATAHGIHVLGIVCYGNRLANGGHDQMWPPDAGRYADYAAYLARRYGPLGVHAWEIWNEENSPNYWKPGVDAAAYVKLLARAYPAIKAADPRATVILGGLAPQADTATGRRPQTFLSDVYRAGGRAYFDAVAMHPYVYTGDDYWFTHGVPDLRRIMVDHGDAAKRIWLTEAGCPSAGADPKYTEAWQADRIRRTLDLQRQFDYLGPLFLYSYQDAGTDPKDIEAHFGVIRRDGTRKPAYQVLAAGG